MSYTEELESKLAALEARIAKLETRSEITLTSPNGKYKLSLLASDKVAGIWANKEDGEMATLYVCAYERDSAVVAVTASVPSLTASGYDIALSSSLSDGPSTQFIKDGKVKRFED